MVHDKDPSRGGDEGTKCSLRMANLLRCVVKDWRRTLVQHTAVVLAQLNGLVVHGEGEALAVDQTVVELLARVRNALDEVGEQDIVVLHAGINGSPNAVTPPPDSRPNVFFLPLNFSQ